MVDGVIPRQVGLGYVEKQLSNPEEASQESVLLHGVHFSSCASFPGS